MVSFILGGVFAALVFVGMVLCDKEEGRKQ